MWRIKKVGREADGRHCCSRKPLSAALPHLCQPLHCKRNARLPHLGAARSIQEEARHSLRTMAGSERGLQALLQKRRLFHAGSEQAR